MEFMYQLSVMDFTTIYSTFHFWKLFADTMCFSFKEFFLQFSIPHSFSEYFAVKVLIKNLSNKKEFYCSLTTKHGSKIPGYGDGR